MKLLAGQRVLALGDMADRPLCRMLASLGAEIRAGRRTTASVKAVDFLVDGLGTRAAGRPGLTRAQLETWNPALVHVSVTAFGSGGDAFALARRRTGCLGDGRRAAADR